MGLLKNIFSSPQNNLWPMQQWQDFINKKTQGKDTIRIVHIDEYPEMLVAYLENDQPLITVKLGGGYNTIAYPMIDDEIIVERNGNSIPIVYNKTTNAQMFSPFTDSIMKEILYMMKFIDIWPSTQMDLMKARLNNRLGQAAIHTVNIITKPLSDKIAATLYSPLMIPKLFVILGKVTSESMRKKFGGVYQKVSLKGRLIFSKHMKERNTSKQGGTYYTNSVWLRIDSFELNTQISCLGYKTTYKAIVFTFPDGDDVQVDGKLDLEDGIVKIDNVWYGKKNIF